MIHRVTSTVPAPYLPNRWGAGWRNTLTGPLSSLIRYILLLAALCAVGCLYLWQASDITDLHDEIIHLRQASQRLEAANAFLMLQLAQWNSPAYIERQANELDLVSGQTPVIVKVTPSQSRVDTRQPGNPTPGSLVQRLAEMVPDH